MSRRGRMLLLLGTASLFAGTLWLYFQSTPRIDLAARVPASAIGYVEINDWPLFADGLGASAAWRELAPEFGLWDKWRYAGTAGRILRATGLGPREAVLLSRSQIALVINSIEVRGEDVRPRVAFILETHSSEPHLTSVIRNRLPQLALKAFGERLEERSEYAGVPVTVFRSAEGERRLLSAQVGSEWIVANHAASMEACIDARLGRAPTMANNFYLENSRKTVAGEGEVFGFVSGEGTTRLAHFTAELVGSRLFGNSPLTEALRSVVTDFSSVVSNGLAYGMGFREGRAVERYAWLCNPQMIEQLKSAIRVKEQAMRLPGFAPSSLEGMTIIRLEDPDGAFTALESAISSRLGAAQSFILHRFVLGAREALFGLKEHERAGTAFGDEMGSISFGSAPDESLWVVAVRDRGLLEQLTGRFLSQNGASMKKESRDGHEMWISSDERRGAACFLGDFLVIGSRTGIVRLLDARRATPVIAEAPQFVAAGPASAGAPVVSFSSVRVETGDMMNVIANYLPRGGPRGKPEQALLKLPLATSSLEFRDRSLFVEAQSSFGSLPFIVSILSQKPEGQVAAR